MHYLLVICVTWLKRLCPAFGKPTGPSAKAKNVERASMVWLLHVHAGFTRTRNAIAAYLAGFLKGNHTKTEELIIYNIKRHDTLVLTSVGDMPTTSMSMLSESYTISRRSREGTINTLRPGWNEPQFADDIFKRIFFNENVWISIKISLKFVPKGPINNIPALVQIMAWRRSGDKPLSKSMMVLFTDAYMRHSASMS